VAENDRIDIRRFVGELLVEKDDRAPFGDGESLVESGRLDSLAVTKLVAFLESEFDVDFAEVEFDPQRFDSVEELVAIVDEARGRS